MWKINQFLFLIINPLASPSAGAPAVKYGDAITETTSPSEVKGLIIRFWNVWISLLFLLNYI